MIEIFASHLFSICSSKVHLFHRLLGALKNWISSDSTYEELAIKAPYWCFLFICFWTTVNLIELLASNRLLVRHKFWIHGGYITWGLIFLYCWSSVLIIIFSPLVKDMWAVPIGALYAPSKDEAFIEDEHLSMCTCLLYIRVTNIIFRSHVPFQLCERNFVHRKWAMNTPTLHSL